MNGFPYTPEVHVQGMVSVENMFEVYDSIAEQRSAGKQWDTDLGLQVSHDGRLWLCVNSIALVRFKPAYSVAEPR